MEEIFRFQQLRQTQKLSKQQKLLVGLPLYPDDNLSAMANELIQTDQENASKLSILERFKKKNDGENLVQDVNDINPSIRSLYDWLNFKSYPFKKSDFKLFVESIPPSQSFDLLVEWISYADNFILAIHEKNISINFCVDYQLLIRVCYLFKLAVIYKNGFFSTPDNLSDHLLATILRMSILLPPKVLLSRCSENCTNKGKIEIPREQVKIDQGDKDPCSCTCNETCQMPGNHCICIKTYISDLFIIKEDLARYEEGDIAHIENILAGEKKVRTHRNLYRSEDNTETENETITNEEKDHQTTEKLSLQTEVKKTIDSKVGIDAGVSATVKYGESITVSPHANVSSNFSKSQSESLARSYAKDIIDRSVTKIQEKVRKLLVSKVVNENEEKNKHSIDNATPGNEHRAGIYYWVNKISHAQVFNYGKHMMFDVIVPEPAAIFKKLFELKNQKDNKEMLTVKPNVTLGSIDRYTYVNLLNQYGLAGAIQPPEEHIAIQMAFHQNLTEPEDWLTTGFSSAEFKSEQIPDGYKAEMMDFSISCFVADPYNQTGAGEAAVSVTVGKTVLLAKARPAGGLNSTNDWSKAGNNIAMNGEFGIITTSIAGYSSVALSLSGTISIQCRLTEEGYNKWKVQIYNLIMEDYSRKLADFESKKKQDPLIQIKGRNPFLNREIERNELKRHIIAILLCNYFNGIGSMMEKVAPCGYPEIDFGKLERDAPVVQFFEQVFEWNYLNYLFYHSMWARKCKWPDLIDEDSGDALFDKFLMAGAARVQIPIRPGMEEIITWFLKTHQIWGASGTPPVSGDDEYVSMIQELKESKQCDYTDRDGFIEATNGSNILKLTDSTFYWDFLNNQVNQLTLNNDKDREILINYKIYRIVSVLQTAPGDNSAWDITIDKPYQDTSLQNFKHAVGALFVGAPWEIFIPTKLVYLRNPTDKLPVYPLT